MPFDPFTYDFRIVGLVLLLLAFVVSLCGVLIRNRRTANGRYRAVEGRVIRVSSFNGSGKNLAEKGSDFEVEYFVDGESYKVRNPGAISFGSFSIYSRGSMQVRRIGEKVELFVDPRHPQIVWTKALDKISCIIMAVSAALSIILLISLLI